MEVSIIARKYNRYTPGQRFGKLTLTERVDKGRKWLAVCDCGNMVKIQVSNGQTMCKECSDKSRSAAKIVHGEAPHPGRSATRLYRIWLAMRSRCNNPNMEQYRNYGGRGIRVCKDWDDYIVFKNWAIENGYNDQLSIDRVDVDGNYCPENCRWATPAEQSRNTRANRMITFRGETKTITDWSLITGIPYKTIRKRLEKYGLSVEEALSNSKEHTGRSY